MSRLQFTIRDLFLATTLIAVGTAGIMRSYRVDDFGEVALFFASLACLGSGVGTPLHSRQAGMTFAFLVLIIVGLFVPLTFPIHSQP